MYEIGYAYATSPLACAYGYDNEGCAYLKWEGKHGQITTLTSDKHNDAIEKMLNHAHLNGMEIEPISKDWAERIAEIRKHQR